MERFSLEKLFLASLGGTLKVKDHVEQTLHHLVTKGDMTREQGNTLIKQMQGRVEAEKSRVESRGHEELRKFFADNDFAFVEDFQKLESRLDMVEARLAELASAKAASTTPSPAATEVHATSEEQKVASPRPTATTRPARAGKSGGRRRTQK